jgi:hypothetical protein
MGETPRRADRHRKKCQRGCPRIGGPLCRGERRAGLALGGALPGPAQLTARQSGDGWIFRGFSPFISGWGRVDLIHTAARTRKGQLVWALLDAQASKTLHVERLDLVALNATATVRAHCIDHRVPSQRVTSVAPYSEETPPPDLLRIHASFPLGVAKRCCRLLKERSFDAELARYAPSLTCASQPRSKPPAPPPASSHSAPQPRLLSSTAAAHPPAEARCA